MNLNGSNVRRWVCSLQRMVRRHGGRLVTTTIQTNKPTSATSRDDAGVDDENEKKNNPTNANPETTNVIRLLRAAQRSKPDMRDHRELPWLSLEMWLWRLVAVLAGLDVLRASICHLWTARTSGVSNANDAMMPMISLLLLAIAIRFISVLGEIRALMTPNDPSSATRRRGGNDCNHDAPAGFAAAHG
jgi:hypothetical protein